MPTVLASRPDIRRLFYRVLGVEPRDGVTSQYDAQVQEAVHYFVQHGLWNAQFWLLNWTPANLWRAQAPLTFTLDPVKGLLYADLPDDFLRLAGDADESALHTNSLVGSWGTLVDHRQSRKAYGALYWIEDDRLWLGRNANPPAGLVMDYHYRHPVIEKDDDPIDFPPPIRPLIAHEAAWLALQESWIPIDDPDTARRVEKGLGFWRDTAARQYGRTSREPRKMTTRSRMYTTQTMI